MNSIMKIQNLNNSSDVSKINSIMSQIEGVIACEISVDRREIQVVYNEAIVKLEDIIGDIEDIGYIVI
ncbi:MAG: heavy-metal-associated domain-containing protein [Clostridium sp.]|nr:heavy-metal-associated domain-containing protein [Clostridium sp.]